MSSIGRGADDNRTASRRLIGDLVHARTCTIWPWRCTPQFILQLAGMHVGAKIVAQGELSGWVLVEAELGRDGKASASHLMVQRRSTPENPDAIFLPVTGKGRIHELVRLPDDTAALDWTLPCWSRIRPSQLRIRPVGRRERMLRMANRALRNWARLTRTERSASGLTLRRIVFDLSGAYQIATAFRGGMSYPGWIEQFDALRDEDLEAIRAHIGRFSSHPHFHLLVLSGNATAAARTATLASLRKQLYRNFSCVLLDDAASSDVDFGSGAARDSVRSGERHDMRDWLCRFNANLAGRGAAEWIMLLQAGDVLASHALYWFASALLEKPDALVIYADDDATAGDGQRCNPRFKPDWSLALLQATNFIGNAAVMRSTALAACGGVTLESCRYGSYDLLLRVVDAVAGAADDKVVHVPAVLLTHGAGQWPTGAASSGSRGEVERGVESDNILSWELQAVRAHLARNGIKADVSETRSACRRVRFFLPQKTPLVTIVIPTRDALTLLRRCIQSVLDRTDYPDYEILVVDNQSSDPQTLTYLSDISKHPKVRILRYDCAFNFSAINNFAVSEARGEALCLLNNDTEVISGIWLEEMVGHLLQPRVGIVGAKLYFPDGRVQHAGDTVGPGGCANHLHAFIGHDDPGYCNRAIVAQELSAVTAACLLTWRELYLDLGGLDEKRLPVAFNDVDYCLRARAAGYRVVWTPHAELIHHESVSRGTDDTLRRRIRARLEVMTMRRRWSAAMWSDPFYNPNLSYQQPDFSLSRAPRVRRPWRSG